MPAPRQSNIELLRMLAMLLVLVLHADYVALGAPTPLTLAATPATATAQLVTEALALVSVNVFVLISGWFGIRPTPRGFANLALQCVYFLGGIYITCVALGRTPLNCQGILSALGLTLTPWFIPAYIALYILSPLLNAYITHATHRQLGLTLLAFYAFQTILDCPGAGIGWIARGYSVFSFTGLYLLAAWLRQHTRAKKPKALTCLAAYLACCLMNAAISLLYLHNNSDNTLFFTSYDNPLVIAAAVALLLCFAQINIGARTWINTLAASCLAVYLLHAGRFMVDFRHLITSAYTRHSGPAALLTMLAIILGVYLAAIILDQPRRLLWRHLTRRKT